MDKQAEAVVLAYLEQTRINMKLMAQFQAIREELHSLQVLIMGLWSTSPEQEQAANETLRTYAHALLDGYIEDGDDG